MIRELITIGVEQFICSCSRVYQFAEYSSNEQCLSCCCWQIRSSSSASSSSFYLLKYK